MFCRKYATVMVNPKLYADNNRITTVINKQCLEKYNHLIKWRNHPSIMEIGHGDGGTSRRTFFPYLPSNLKEFVATDFSPNMVEYARKNAILPLMTFEQLNIATKDLPLKYLGRFHHIFGFFVMHMVRNSRQAFINMYEMLKPGGSIFHIMFERTPVDDSMDKLSKHPEWSKYGVEKSISPHFYSPNPRQEWEKDLNRTGFNNYEFLEENGFFEFLDDNEFDDLLLSVCTFLPNIPEDKLEEFKTMYRELTRNGKLISTQVRDGKKIISFEYKLFIISATKNLYNCYS